jgi:hypothetical protein
LEFTDSFKLSLVLADKEGIRAGASGPSGLQIYLDFYITLRAEHLSGQEGLLAPALKSH